MPRLSEMPAPDFPLSGLELVPVLQGAGLPGNRGVPILAYGHLPRGAVLALRRPVFADMSATVDADPGAAAVRWDNADPDAAAMLYINDVDDDAGDLSVALAGLAVGGHVYLQGAPVASRDNWQKWEVTSITAASGYTKVGVSLQASNGVFADVDQLELTVQQPDPLADGDVVGPASSTDGHYALFDGTTGKLLKDGGPPAQAHNTTTALTSGVTVTVDLSLGDFFTLTLAHNATIAFSGHPGSGKGFSVRLKVTQDVTGSRTLTQPAEVKLIPGGDSAIQSAAESVSLIHYSSDDNGATIDATIKARGV